MLRLVLSFLCTVISAVFVLALLPIVFLHLLYLKGLYALLRLRLQLRLCTRCGAYLKRKAGIPVDGLDMLALVETLTLDVLAAYHCASPIRGPRDVHRRQSTPGHLAAASPCYFPLYYVREILLAQPATIVLLLLSAPAVLFMPVHHACIYLARQRNGVAGSGAAPGQQTQRMVTRRSMWFYGRTTLVDAKAQPTADTCDPLYPLRFPGWLSARLGRVGGISIYLSDLVVLWCALIRLVVFVFTAAAVLKACGAARPEAVPSAVERTEHCVHDELPRAFLANSTALLQAHRADPTTTILPPIVEDAAPHTMLQSQCAFRAPCTAPATASGVLQVEEQVRLESDGYARPLRRTLFHGNPLYEPFPWLSIVSAHMALAFVVMALWAPAYLHAAAQSQLLWSRGLITEERRTWLVPLLPGLPPGPVVSWVSRSRRRRSGLSGLAALHHLVLLVQVSLGLVAACWRLHQRGAHYSRWRVHGKSFDFALYLQFVPLLNVFADAISHSFFWHTHPHPAPSAGSAARRGRMWQRSVLQVMNWSTLLFNPLCSVVYFVFSFPHTHDVAMAVVFVVLVPIFVQYSLRNFMMSSVHRYLTAYGLFTKETEAMHQHLWLEMTTRQSLICLYLSLSTFLLNVAMRFEWAVHVRGSRVSGQAIVILACELLLYEWHAEPQRSATHQRCALRSECVPCSVHERGRCIV